MIDRRTLLVAAGTAAMGVARPQAPAWAGWRVNGDRINGWLKELSRFGANPGGGVSRTGFSDADVEARRWLMGIMREVGLSPAVDPAGNIIARVDGTEPGLKPLLFGSHIDSVPNGGNYDGDVGSLGAVEVMATLKANGYRHRHPWWVTVWADEESGLVGSRGFLGAIPQDELARTRVKDTVPLGELIRKVGGDPAAMAGYRQAPGSIAGYVELHIEQGGTLDQADQDIGVVEGIVGILRHEVTITGFANHAGTTPMAERRNALLAASELTLAVDRIVKRTPGRQVGTVGRLEVKPGAENVIPGEVQMSIELRDLDMAKAERLWGEIETEANTIMTRQRTTWKAKRRPPNVAALADPALKSTVAAAAQALGFSQRSMPSGAGHDAQNLARLGPMGMIFVPSVGGISHAPQEFTEARDVTNGVNLLMQTMLRLDQGP
ncbi:MAG: Zn-dependent hydrolase [Gemmatimonadales bacterium]